MDRLVKISERTRALSSLIEVMRNVWGMAALLCVGAVLLVQLFVARYGPGRTLSLAAASLCAAAACFALGWYAARRRLVTSDYSWESADYTYQFDPDDCLRHVQIAKITIRANRPGIQLFRNRYFWTGVGRSRLTVLSPQHRLLTELARDAWRYYYVLLEQALSKGSSTTIVVRHDLYDAERMFQPLITKDVSEALSRLTMRIVFPQPLRPSRVLAAEMARTKARDAYWEVIRERELPVHEITGEVVYTLERPTLGRRYQLLWSWTGYPTPERAFE